VTDVKILGQVQDSTFTRGIDYLGNSFHVVFRRFIGMVLSRPTEANRIWFFIFLHAWLFEEFI
jgi:hypothetical protein